jgi:ABC-type cobalamin/Fe3+-siderophores transport system ATPase subunit
MKDSLHLLRFIEDLLIEEDGQSLSDIQRHIIEELLNGKTYKEIADSYGYDEKHIGDVSRNKIFKVLSKQLGLEEKELNKSNFRWNIEKAVNSQLFTILNKNINYCVKSPQPDTTKPIENKEKSPSETSYHDLSLAPKINRNFCDRFSELEILAQKILTENKPLISVLGLSGIGKTTLVRHFVELNLEKFEVIIWQNLKIANCLDTIITDIFTKINRDFILNNHDELTLFLKLLQQKKCLIIFDNVQELFREGELAGQYQIKYRDYQKLFSIISNEIEHQSSLILISQERCSEMYYSDEKLDLLELQGLNNRAILNNLGLEDEESCLKLVQMYERNLSYLKDIAVLIKDVYHGCVSEFLQEENILITAKIKESLTAIIKRLSPIEKQIIQALSNLEKDCSRNELKSSLDLSGDDFIKGLQSLQKRYLLTEIKESEILFNLSPVFKKYIKDTGI